MFPSPVSSLHFCHRFFSFREAPKLRPPPPSPPPSPVSIVHVDGQGIHGRVIRAARPTVLRRPAGPPAGPLRPHPPRPLPPNQPPAAAMCTKGTVPFAPVLSAAAWPVPATPVTPLGRLSPPPQYPPVAALPSAIFPGYQCGKVTILSNPFRPPTREVPLSPFTSLPPPPSISK
jgi:hypothetical protein